MDSIDPEKARPIRIAYPGKKYFGTAMELIDRNETFITVVEGEKGKRIYVEAEVYLDFMDRYVGSLKPKSRRILWKLFWIGLSNIDFWSICFYGQNKRKGIAFTFKEDRLEVIFDFGLTHTKQM